MSLYLRRGHAPWLALLVVTVLVDDPVTLHPTRVPVQTVVVVHCVADAVEAGHIVEVWQSLTVCVAQL